jgi:hypothetical protein
MKRVSSNKAMCLKVYLILLKFQPEEAGIVKNKVCHRQWVAGCNFVYKPAFLIWRRFIVMFNFIVTVVNVFLR